MIKSLIKSTMALAAGWLLLTATPAQAISFDFSSTIGGSLGFAGTGDTFSFNNGLNGYDFQITLVHDGVGTAAGLFGNIGGTYQIGAITIAGPKQSAPVSLASGVGTNVFSIFDGATTFSGLVNWIQIDTEGQQGGLNKAGGVINLTNITYGGSNADLLAFIASSNSGTVNVSFQFSSAKTLTDLTANGVNTTTSYSGSAASVPDGGLTLALLGMSMMGIEGIRRRMKKA